MVISHRLIRLILMLFGLITQLTVSCDARRRGYRFRNNTSSRIIDGVEAGDGEFKDFVGLLINKPGQNLDFYCGGVLLRKFLVLTAGHCLDGVTNANDIRVLNTVKSPFHWSNQERNRAVRVAEFCRHPSYWNVDGKIWFDYAILRLQRSLNDYEIGGIADNFVRGGETVTAVGIGFSHYDQDNKKNNEWPFRLRKLEMELVDCDGFNSGNTHVCFTSEFGGDVCFGDSGSPVYNGNGEVVAITSYGNPGENCLHNYKAKTVFAEVVGNKGEIDSLIDKCRLRGPQPPDPPDEDEDEIAVWIVELELE